MKTRASKILISVIIIVLFSAVIVTTALLSLKNKGDNNIPPSTSGGPAIEDTNPPVSGGENSEPEEPAVPELTVVDKIYLMIANSDEDIYNMFKYFVDAEGKIINEHVDLSNSQSEVESICELLYAYITSIYGNVDKITNEMYNNYDSINKKVNELLMLFGENMKY